MPDFGLAGAEIMCENLTYTLRERGHDVTVISMYDYHSAITERMEKSGIRIIYLNKKLGLDFSIIRKMKKVFKEIKPDVIHTHRNCPQYAIPAAISAGVKHRVHTFHSIAPKENGRLARLVNGFFFKHCHLVPVALSELVRDSIVEEYRIKPEKIPVVFNGIDLTKCIPKTDYSTDGNFKILHIGRFSEPKNHAGLLRAFNKFHQFHQDSELWLVGDGEKRSEIESYVSENNLADSVKFLGLQSDVYGFLHDADMFTLPSNYEGIPMTLIEAMGTGLPIVATAVGGIPDMLTNDENALIIDNNIEAISRAFEIYYKDPELRKCYGEKAKGRSSTFSAVTMAQKYESIYSLKT